MAFVYKDNSYALILAFPDNCPGCNESYVKWNYVHHEMISSPTNVYHSGKKEYSVGKGLAGAALLGPIGALAGVNGKRTYGYTTKEGEYSYRISAQCPKCGYLHEITSRSYPEFKKHKTMEKKKVLGIEEIEDLAKSLSSTVDLPSKIKEALLHAPMETEDIYEYLKKNNYLSEEVLSAEKCSIESKGAYGEERFKRNFLYPTLIGLLAEGVIYLDDTKYKCLTEQEEVKAKNEEAEIEDLAESLSSTVVDLSSKIEEALALGPMEIENIYEYLKKNNYLPEEVLSAEKKAGGCITADGGNLGWSFKLSFLHRTLSDLEEQKVVCRESIITYRLLTEQEKISAEKEKAKEVEIENLAKRLSTIVDLPSKIEEALSCNTMGVYDIYEYLKKKNYLPEAVLNAEKKAEGYITTDGGNLGNDFKFCFLIDTIKDLEKQGVACFERTNEGTKVKLLSK